MYTRSGATDHGGTRAESPPKSGVTSMSVIHVAAIIQGRYCIPPSIVISSRTKTQKIATAEETKK